MRSTRTPTQKFQNHPNLPHLLYPLPYHKLPIQITTHPATSKTPHLPTYPGHTNPKIPPKFHPTFVRTLLGDLHIFLTPHTP